MGRLGDRIREIRWAFNARDARRIGIEELAGEADAVEARANGEPCPFRRWENNVAMGCKSIIGHKHDHIWVKVNAT